ncbi:MAG: urease accessory protein UreF [Rhizobiaceae bacterium]
MIIIITIMVIRMTDEKSLIQLMTWLSPAFPVGGFSYSSGLEHAVGEGLVSDRHELKNWLKAQLRSGSLWNDAVFVSLGRNCKDNDEKLLEVNELALAMAGSSGRHVEVTSQGNAFIEAAELNIPCFDGAGDIAYPIALGAAAGVVDIEEIMMIAAFLNASVTNQAQAAIRLGILGQKDGVLLVAELQPEILECARNAEGAGVEDLGSNTMLAEISAMKQESMTTRLFRS